MTISADFTVSNRIGDNFNTVTFTDTSIGTIDDRQWILGDGTVIEGNQTIVKHSYIYPGKYDVTLIARNTTTLPIDQGIEIKTQYIIVNEVKPTPNFIIMQSFDLSSGSYWRFYLDVSMYLIFETNQFIYRSIDKIADVRKWTFVNFNVFSEKMFYGNYYDYYREIPTEKMINTSPIVPTETITEIAYQSQLKIDELKIFGKERNLSEYYKSVRGRAGYLDLK